MTTSVLPKGRVPSSSTFQLAGIAVRRAIHDSLGGCGKGKHCFRVPGGGSVHKSATTTSLL